MLENLIVKSVDNKNITISVNERDYGKLRGAEEGVYQRTGKPNKSGKYKLTKVKRPFFHLSSNDIDAIQNTKDYQRILDNAAVKMANDILRKSLAEGQK